MRKGKQTKITYNIQITWVRLSKVQITSQPVQVDIFKSVIVSHMASFNLEFIFGTVICTDYRWGALEGK
jgi:hypothetical protein